MNPIKICGPFDLVIVALDTPSGSSASFMRLDPTLWLQCGGEGSKGQRKVRHILFLSFFR